MHQGADRIVNIEDGAFVHSSSVYIHNQYMYLDSQHCCLEGSS